MYLLACILELCFSGLWVETVPELSGCYSGVQRQLEGLVVGECIVRTVGEGTGG